MSERYGKAGTTDNGDVKMGTLRTHRVTNAATAEDFSPAALKRLSEVRRGQIQDAVINKPGYSGHESSNNGIVGVRSNPKKRMEADIKRAMDTTPSLYKIADGGANGFGSGLPGGGSRGGGVDRAMPEIYSPLFQVANLNLPRDRMTMNAWNRNFFDTHPIVRNAITLHATYPISKINVKCKHRKVEQFFNDMAERIDLFDAIAGVALEYFKMGEVFPYAELDENNGIWSSIVIQNPDYVTVKKSGVSNTPVISLRPDEILKKIVSSNHPADVKLRSQIPDNIIHHIRKNEPIPLDNFNVSHLKMLSSPYDVRGTSIIVSCYKDLMLYDKLRECFSDSAEFLTNCGFKKYTDLITINDDGTISPNLQYSIATYNTKTNKLEYQYATSAVLRDYKGTVKHFSGQKVDLTVTPGHRMYIKTTGKSNGKTHWKDYYFTEAKNITDKTYCKFKSMAEYTSDNSPKNIVVNDKVIPIELYLEFLGYIVSEGCVYIKTDNDKNGNLRYDYKTTINQYTSSPHYPAMRTAMEKIANIFNHKLSSYTRINNFGYAEANPGEQWNGCISSKELTIHLKEQIGINGNTISHNKHLPRQVLDLAPHLLQMLLDALMRGDGCVVPSKYINGNSTAYRYSTVSKQLADDVYELVYKCGKVPTISICNHKYDNRDDVVEYLVLWSDTVYGDEPIIYGNPKHNGAKVYDEDYDGKVWCLTVPNGTVLVRNNGKISIQGNCYSEETEILTDNGFKVWQDVINVDQAGTVSPNLDYKIACYDQKTDQIVYDHATDVVLRDYEGEMVKIKSKNIDLLVTPGHELLVNNEINGWHKVRAETLLGKRLLGYKVKNTGTWVGRRVKYFETLGKIIPAELYLKFLGYLLSEGCLTRANKPNQPNNGVISFTQAVTSDCYDDMRNTIILFAKYFDKKVIEVIRQPLQYNFKKLPSVSWQGSINFGDLYKHFKELIGTDEGCTSEYKHIPRFIFDLCPEQLHIILSAMVSGDGSEYDRAHCKTFKYFTKSPQLASDVQEIVFKCGFYSSLRPYKQNGETYYDICWSTSGFGKTPGLYNSRTNKSHITTVNYNGKVWCVTVPTGIVVIRNNGRVAIQAQCKFAQADSLVNPITLISVGGSGEGEFHPSDAQLEAYKQIFEEAQWDKDFKIVTHAAVKVERVGASGAILDTQNDFNFIRENLYAGLMVPKSVMDTEGSAYASASIGLEVLRDRYLTFRNMVEKWLEKKIFAPISQIQGFFEYNNGKKVLIVPQIDWNHINLYDMNEYIQALGGYVEKSQISVHTLYRSLGLNWEEEQRLIREEMVRGSIMSKEQEELKNMSLIELRALDPDEPIVENAKSETVPGEALPDGEDGGIPMPDLGAPLDMGSGGGAGIPPMPGVPLENTPPVTPSSGTEPAQAPV